jgi:hypothetical protein
LQWIKEKANIKDFVASPAAIVFHLSVAAVLWLYVQFWVRLNMFQTLQILVVLAPIVIISGKFTLSALAEKVSPSPLHSSAPISPRPAYQAEQLEAHGTRTALTAIACLLCCSHTPKQAAV